MNDETLLTATNLTHTLFDCLANAGELNLTIMTNKILAELETEIALRGGKRALISPKAVFPTFCPKFKASSNGQPTS